MNEHGQLTDAGIEWIKRNVQDEEAQSGDDEIIEIFNPNTNFYRGNLSARQTRRREWLKTNWREKIVQTEAISFLHAEPRRLTSAGALVNSGRASAGLYANPSGSSIVIINRQFVTVFHYIRNIISLPIQESSFIFGTTGPNNDLRSWSVLRFLVYALRGNNSENYEDPFLRRSYLKAHLHYLNALQDPLRFLNADEIAQARLGQRPSVFEIRNFQALGSQRGQDSSVPYHALAAVWFHFLFTSYNQSQERRVGSGFIANEDQLRNQIIQNVFRNRRSQGDEADFIEGMKMTANKQPDIIQIFPDRRHIDVIDATFRFKWPNHNFKTAFYCAVLRAIFNNSTGDSSTPSEGAWTVEGFDYQTLRYVTQTP